MEPATMAALSTAAAGGASLLGGILSNAQTAAMTRDQMAFQERMVGRKEKFDVAQIDKMMNFQREMSDSAIQRRVRDARLANVNPLYALGLGGASTPMGGAASGAMASGASADMRDVLTPAMATAIQVRTAFEQMKNLQEQNKNLKEQNAEIQMRTALYKAQFAREQVAANKMASDNTRGWIDTALSVGKAALPVGKVLYGLVTRNPALVLEALGSSASSLSKGGTKTVDADKYYGKDAPPTILMPSDYMRRR